MKQPLYNLCFKIILLLIALQGSCMISMAQDNPFVRMDSQKYSEYFETLKSVYLGDEHTPEQSVLFITQMREVAKSSGNPKWNLEADYLEKSNHFYKKLPPRSDDSLAVNLSEAYIADILVLAGKAEEMDAQDLQLRILYEVFLRYGYPIKNYELAFRYARILDQMLDKIPAEDFPLKPKYYSDIAELYLQFREYESAEKYFQKILENPEIAYQARTLEATYNNLGLIYRDYYKDLNKADSCFALIFNTKPTNKSLQFEYNLWSAIAMGNMGENAYVRGEYDKAIPRLRYSMEKVVEDNVYNYTFAAGNALTLADIYIKLKKPEDTKAYLDTARFYMNKSTDQSSLSYMLFSITSRYYVLIGNSNQALLYMDSTAKARREYGKEFNAKKLLRAEQRLKQEELEIERIRSENHLRNLIIISIALFIVIVLFTCYYCMYRKKRSAYQKLVLQSQAWAHTVHREDLEDSGKQTVPVSNEDYELMRQVDNLMVTMKLYSQPSFSLEMLALEMDVTRERMSKIINQTKGCNFKQYLNEFRIKEAILLISDPTNKNTSLDVIIEKVGYSRTAFYDAFKKKTGLSPAEFRKNL